MKVTNCIAVLLILITIGVNLTRPSVPEALEGTPVSVAIGSSPIEKEFYYDWPTAFTLIDKISSRYGDTIWETPQEIPPAYLNEIAATPIWQGFFPRLLGYVTPPAPWFEKISEGEVWRLFTPALLHSELFHLCFNLFWLIALGRLVEERTGGMRYILLTLFFGIFANTAQYLMSGMRFLGYSGVITGLFGYAYVDQKKGTSYPFPPGAFRGIFIFIIGLALVETFLLISPLGFSTGVANTAHIAGLIAGLAAGLTKKQ